MNTTPNTIESIITACESGVDIVEMDIRFLKDGTPVLSHEPITADNKNTVIMLSDAFECVKNYPQIKVNLDIKSTENLLEVQELAKEKGLIHRIFYTGIYSNFVSAVKKNSPEVSYYLNCNAILPLIKSRSYLNHLVNKTKRFGAVGINLNKAYCSSKLTDIFHENNLLVSVWTVSDISSARKCLSMHPDNITCKNPKDIFSLLPLKSA